MCTHAETFHANKGWKLAIVFFIPILSFSKYKFRVQENEASHTPTFYMKMHHFDIVSHMT